MVEVVLCPRCGRREVEPTAPEGFCAECIIERIRELYGTKQRAATIARREAWSERAQESFDRDRQRVHRLKEMVRPREPVSSLDPWELAHDALGQLKILRTAVKKAEQLERVEVIAEALRRLAFGPDDEPAKRKPEAEPEPDSEPEREWAWTESWRRADSAALRVEAPPADGSP